MIVYMNNVFLQPSFTVTYPYGYASNMLSSLVMSVFIRQIMGAPLPTYSSCTPSTIPLVDTASCTQSDQRSLWDIVWGCIITIFSCTWIAIHPNIPGPDDSRWCALKRGVTTMICALIAPELMIGWALRQHAGATQIMHRYNEDILKIQSPPIPFYRPFVEFINRCFWGEECDKSNDIKWTKTHGFFIQMGGFMLYKDGVPVKVLTYRRLDGLIKEGQVDILRITTRTIRDKSKSDHLSKVFIVVQTTWFVVQCIARLAQSLPLAELEVFTLAFAALNAIIYAIWFDKPQNVQEGIRVDLKPTPLGPADCRDRSSPESELPEPLSPEPPLPEKFHSTQGYPALFKPMKLFRPIRKLTSSKSGNWREDNVMHRVPMFGYETLAYIPWVLELYLPCLLAILYGSLHVIAWNSGPTKFERHLWKYSTLVVIIDPLFCIFFMRLGSSRRGGMKRHLDKHKSFRFIFFFLSTVCMCTYAIARVALIVQVLVSLRQLPPATFCDVAWSSFIPHF